MVEKWVNERPVMKQLALNNALIHGVLKVADMDNWRVEEFLAECIVQLVSANESAKQEFIAYMNANPAPVVLGDKEYRYVGPSKSAS
jgi:hypothetical protein